MLEIISFNNEHITIKVKKNKKEILNSLVLLISIIPMNLKYLILRLLLKYYLNIQIIMIN